MPRIPRFIDDYLQHVRYTRLAQDPGEVNLEDYEYDGSAQIISDS